MNTIKSFLLLFLVASVTLFTTQAQNSENPWAIAVGVDLINLQGDNVDSGINFGAPALSLSRYLGAGFSVGAQYALNNLKNNNEKLGYSSLDGVVKYNLTDEKIIPYLFAGYGIARFKGEDDKKGFFPSTESSANILGGLGVNFFLDDHFAINVSTSYRGKRETHTFNHLKHIVGLSYNFGAGDADKDGVSDQKDVCPDVPGLKEFEGCPDTDGDGIPDNKDRCPDQAGKAEFQGCPDTDGDGVPDSEDQCPNAAGSANMNGCPDSDGDGIADNVDRCPQTAGDPSNAGCPFKDSDGDGVYDRDDKCPDVAGSKSNGGCPEDEDPSELVNFINSDANNILFNVNSSNLDSSDKMTLDQLKSLLDRYPDASITIEGHASSDGSSGFNQALSEKRAEAVKDYLVSKGISADRISTVGYGETRLIGDNNTANGRKMSRRANVNRRAKISVN